jgi:HAD superfamily hydrolase (TIGR01509 family)
LLLDFDGVLADFHHPTMVAHLASQLDIAPSAITAALRSAAGTPSAAAAFPWQWLSAELQVALDQQQWQQARMAATSLRRDCRLLLQQVPATCALAILSNNPQALAAPIADALALRGLDASRVLTSAALGLRKPDPACFGRALELLDGRADSTLFIDNLFTNVRGARAAGLMADTAHHTQSLRKVLRRFQLLR